MGRRSHTLCRHHKPGYVLTNDVQLDTMSVLRYMKESAQTEQLDARGRVDELMGKGKLVPEGPGVASSRHPWKSRCDSYGFCPLGVGNKEEFA